LNNTFTVYYTPFYMLWPEINPVQQDFHFQMSLQNWRSTLQKYVLSIVKFIASYCLLHNINLYAQNTHTHTHIPVCLNSIVSVIQQGLAKDISRPKAKVNMGNLGCRVPQLQFMYTMQEFT